MPDEQRSRDVAEISSNVSNSIAYFAILSFVMQLLINKIAARLMGTIVIL